MDVRVSLSAAELVASVHEFLPYQVDISADGNQKRWLRVNAPDSVEFVPKEGMRIVASATLHHGVPLVPDVKIRRSVMMMRPHILEGEPGDTLAFAVTLDELDTKGIPGFIDQSIQQRVNDKMHEHRRQIGWNFTKTLTRAIGLGQRSVLIDAVQLRAGRGTLVVLDDGITLSLSIGVGFVRRTPT